MAIDSKRIAKNTSLLYFRLILVFGITLFTSRVVLDTLGVDDYGLYNVVYGVIGILLFLRATFSSGSSRFITYALGKGDVDNLKKTFNTVFICHLVLSLVIFVLGETLGLWYVCKVMITPSDRFIAAMIVYQISIIATIISIIQVPFHADIIAHEQMNIYAYLGIYEAIAKLIIVYLISYSEFDRLIFYAVLVCVVQLSVLVINIVYCKLKYKESKISFSFESTVLKSIINFSGWNMIANLSVTFMNQGVLMLFNLFFAPVVVAAQAISTQISNAMMEFVNNIRAAVNPQVIKLYANSNFQESRKLTLLSARYIFDILLLFGIPCIIAMPTLLDIWLVEVPEYTVVFAQLIIFQNIMENFNAAFYTPMVAANKIKYNSVVCAILCVFQFGLLYFLFNIGLDAIWARIIGILFSVIWSFVVKPFILWKYIGYSTKELFSCIIECIKVLCAVIGVNVLIVLVLPEHTIISDLIKCVLSVASVIIISFIFMDKGMKIRVYQIVTNTLKILSK